MKTFEGIIGYEDVKNELARICDILCNPKKYADLGVSIPKGLLLYGMPGVGKTTMVKAFIEAVGRKSFVCRKNKPDGEFVKEITSIFDEAKANIPSVVFLDDMDKFANGDEMHRNDEEYVTIQSCIDDAKDLDVFVVATANSTRHLPDSLLRAGRFDKTIEIDAPKDEDAEKIVEYYISKKKCADDVDCREISRILEGKSCAELEVVMNEAGIYAGYEGRDCIEMNDIIRACLRMIYEAPEHISVSKGKNLEQIACHEAGHAVLHEILDPGSVTLVSVKSCSDKIGGFTASYKPDEYWYSKKLMENRVIEILGGKAATDIMYGVADVGVNSDLHRAFDIVERFVDNYCSYSFDRWIQDGMSSNDLLSRREIQMSVEMERFYATAKEILTKNKDFFDRLVRELVEKKTLTGAQVRALMR